MADNRTGQQLIRAGLISEDQLEFALAEQARGGDRLGVVMRRLNLVTEDAMTRVLAEAAGIEYINLRLQSIDPTIIESIPEQYARDKK